MTAKKILREVVEFGHMVIKYYVSDLSDAEILVRSVPGSNHIAWQMGHMIASTHHMLKGLGHSAPDLPAGFEESYTKETSASDDPKKFAVKKPTSARFQIICDQKEKRKRYYSFWSLFISSYNYHTDLGHANYPLVSPFV